MTFRLLEKYGYNDSGIWLPSMMDTRITTESAEVSSVPPSSTCYFYKKKLQVNDYHYRLIFSN